MWIAQRWIVPAVAAMWLTACSANPTARQLGNDSVAAMGGPEMLRSVKTIVMKGGGTRERLGQAVKHDDPEQIGQLTNLVETLDLINGRAAFDYDVKIGAFIQHRREVITRRGEGSDAPAVGIETAGARPTVAMSVSGLFSWAAQNSPEFLLKRNAISMALAAADSASDTPAADKEFNGAMYKYASGKTKSGEDIGFYFDAGSKLLAGFEVTDTETMLGDVPAQYILDDYKAVDGITLPHHIRIRKGGEDYSEVRYSSITIGDPKADDIFAIPQTLQAEAARASEAGDHVPLKLVKVARGVFFAQALSHHSMVVEFPNWVAVVEAPYTETQSKVLARLVRQQFKGKPIKYVAVTHPHYDHVGGVRYMAAIGATILVERHHEADLRAILDAPHSYPADELDSRRHAQPPREIGSIDVYEGRKLISEGGQTLGLYPITGSPHAEPMVLSYVPATNVLFQSDLFVPGTGDGGPLAGHLLASIRKLNLAVDTIVGGHGGTGPFEELVIAVGPAN